MLNIASYAPACIAGLNITGANKVVIFDPNWNPAHDLQAQDRAFRLGQKRDVSVYRLIAAGTLEEHVYKRQVLKQQMSNMATTDENQRRFFNPDEELHGLDNLLTMHVGKKTGTLKAIERAEQNEADAVMTSKGISVEEFKLAATVKNAAAGGNNSSGSGGGGGGGSGGGGSGGGGQHGGDNDLGELDSDDEYDLELVVDEMEEAAEKAATAYEHANRDILRTTEGEDARVARALKKAQRRKEGLDTDDDDDDDDDRAAGDGDGDGNGGGAGGPGGGPADRGNGTGAAAAAVIDESSTVYIQYKAMANKFGYQQDTLEFSKHWVSLDAGQRLALMDKFYG